MSVEKAPRSPCCVVKQMVVQLAESIVTTPVSSAVGNSGPWDESGLSLNTTSNPFDGSLCSAPPITYSTAGGIGCTIQQFAPVIAEVGYGTAPQRMGDPAVTWYGAVGAIERGGGGTVGRGCGVSIVAGALVPAPVLLADVVGAATEARVGPHATIPTTPVNATQVSNFLCVRARSRVSNSG